jgi:hypothetical protein
MDTTWGELCICRGETVVLQSLIWVSNGMMRSTSCDPQSDGLHDSK